MTTKLTIEIAVIHCDLTLVAKYAFSQALSHLEIRLAGSKGDSKTGPLTLWDSVGLPLDPLGPHRPTP